VQREWEETQSAVDDPDLDYFLREILPGLAKVTLAEIMEAVGISKSFASQVRAGNFLHMLPRGLRKRH
jgi:hypothetical protein